MTDDHGDESLENAREALSRARTLLESAGLESTEAILDRARAAMAELEQAEHLAGGGEGPTPPGKGAKRRILAYFLARGIDVAVSGRELRRISGIQEWARRVRELRVEEGWDIRYDGHDYRLMSEQPNKEIAEAWHLAQAIRDTSLSARDRILQYLQARIGQIVNSELLEYVSGVQEHDRAIRELRNELGYAVSTYIDRPDLKHDEYILESSEPILDLTSRHVSETLRKTVFERDGYRCVLCSRDYGPGVLLVTHPLQQKEEGGLDTDPENFVTLCQTDHTMITADQQHELLKRRRRRISEHPPN
jgi:5-methylcytosine-specific restriction endonuclease McrA